MQKLTHALMLVSALLAATASDAQTTLRLRGTITGLEGSTLTVRSREGETVRLQVPDTAAIAVAKAVRFEDIQPGDFVGATTKKGADGSLVAIEVHYLPPTATAGQTASDLEPEALMTNARVEAAVSATGARELTLQLKDGAQKISVPASAVLVRAVPGTRADLKPGEYVFATLQRATDGSLSVPRVQVSRDGVRPAQ
jgi:hypothetical protein